MNYKVIQSEQASNDLDEIIGYISTKLFNRTAAANFLTELSHQYSVIASQPYAYPISRDPYLASKKYRFFTVLNYIVFYTTADKLNEVRIARILYAHRSYNSLL
ncbi:MAG: type II toxin-antitoxin system RelE/ParE family toxin [Clostridiales Family XIII bacterium]|jgi:plasmid stabilization system protein ParE|nr:type II toxin-antitoxin system RelE/ParE family toxin [Clostridiales Family XIII bacterium]